LTGDFDASEAALAELERTPCTEHWGALLGRERARIEASQGRHVAAIERLRDTIVHCRARGLFLVEGWVQRDLAVYAQAVGHLSEARRAAEQSLQISRQVGLPMVELSALVTLGDLALAEDRPQQAIPPLEEARRLALRRGDGRHHGLILVNLALARFATGDDRAAEGLLAELCDGLSSREASGAVAGTAHALRAVVLWVSGAHSDAGVELERAAAYALQVAAVGRMVGLVRDAEAGVSAALDVAAEDPAPEVRVAARRLRVRR
jgi:tetratricopeptide (TPR) repeat protein